MSASNRSEIRIVPGERIEQLIMSVRGRRVIFDSDLAELYGVVTKVLNQAVKRNAGRFPDDFSFVLTQEEVTNLRSQIVTSSWWGGTRYLPRVFTEHGAIMAANVLNSEKAVEMSVFVVRAFVRMRQELLTRDELEKRLDQIEKVLLVHDDALRDVYDKIRPLLLPPSPQRKKPIGFELSESSAEYRSAIKSLRKGRES